MKKLCAVIAFLFTVTMSSCAVTSEGSAAGQNETGVNGPQTDPVNAHIMLLGSYADSYGGAYVEDGKHYLLVTCDPDTMGETADLIRGQGYILKKVVYTYAELEMACEEINQLFQSQEVPSELRESVTSWSIRQKENCISVIVVSQNGADGMLLDLLGFEPEIIKFVYVDQKPETL